MTALVPIATPADSSVSGSHHVKTLPVLVIFPHNQCNCRCVMCDIWRIRDAKEITPSDIQKQLDSIGQLGVRWVVLSGGEPQLNAKWSGLAQLLRSAGIRVSLLTAGLLLEQEAQVIADSVDDVIVSLDGPPEVHNKIRRVPEAFERMAAGVRALRVLRPDLPIRARCTIQKANHRELRAVVRTARDLGLISISFLASDLTSSAFNRPEGWSGERRDRVALQSEEVNALEEEIEHLVTDHRSDLDSGFVVESPDKFRRIVQHFRAHLGQAEAVAPRCNAPWVSAVVEASGDVRPCFFHPVIGNIHSGPFGQIINGPQALQFRATLDVASNAVCRDCVCSLYIPED